MTMRTAWQCGSVAPMGADAALARRRDVSHRSASHRCSPRIEVRQLAALLGSSHSAQQAGSTPASTLLLAREGMEPWLPAFARSPRKLVQTTGTVADLYRRVDAL